MRKLLSLALFSLVSATHAINWDFELNVDDLNPNLTNTTTAYVPLSATMFLEGSSVTLTSRTLKMGPYGSFAATTDESQFPLTAFGPGYDNDNVVILPLLHRYSASVPLGTASWLSVTLTDSLGGSVTHTLNFTTGPLSDGSGGGSPDPSPEPASIAALAGGLLLLRRRTAKR